MNQKKAKMKNIIKSQNSQPATIATVFDDIFQNSFSRFFEENTGGLSGNGSGSRVPTNIRETENTYLLELFAPGRRKEDFNLAINGDLLTISFNRSSEQEQGNSKEGWIRREYAIDSFSRGFTCDDSIDVEKVNARYENGVLQLILPKKAGARQLSRTISVQ